MIADLISGILEEILGEAFWSLFRRAPNHRIRRLKILGWLSLIASIALIVSAFTIMPQRFVAAAFLAGVTCAVLFFVFGIWASLARRHLDEPGA